LPTNTNKLNTNNDNDATALSTSKDHPTKKQCHPKPRQCSATVHSVPPAFSRESLLRICYHKRISACRLP
jgi:hypothetical protein